MLKISKRICRWSKTGCKHVQSKLFSSKEASYKLLSTNETLEKQIQQQTEVTRDHMTPEIMLHLITPRCRLWLEQCNYTNCFKDPFWAFYWPGGQVLSRFILDHRSMFRGQTVLDVGSGCGASSIACRLAGASRVIANDVDPVAQVAANLNARMNHVTIETVSQNLIGHNSSWNIVLLGDMFYDEEMTDMVSVWLKLLAANKTTVLIGDPGRIPLLSHPIRDELTKVGEYDLPAQCRDENSGMHTGYIWKYGDHNILEQDNT